MVQINIEIKKKHLYLLVALITILSGITIAIAYNAGGTGGDPAVMGHSVDEIDFSRGDTYDVWIAGGPKNIQGPHSDERNLALLGISEDYSGSNKDTLYLNYYSDGTSEYDGGVRIGGPVTIYGDLEVTGTSTGSGGGASAQVVRSNTISTSSSTWKDMPNMAVTVTTNGGDVLVMFSATMKTEEEWGGDTRLLIDGIEKHGLRWETGENQGTDSISLQWLEKGLSAGSHTFKIQWHSWTWEGHTNTIEQKYYPRVLTVVEL